MQALEVLSRRMATLESIHSVVRTMKTLSAVNAAPYESAAASIDRFHETVLRGLQIVLRGIDPPRRPGPADPMLRIALVFGSDHGLCGGYNEAVAATALGDANLDGATFFAVGARMEATLEALGAIVSQRFTPPASVDGVGRLASEVLIALDQAQTQAQAPGGDIAVTTVHMRRGVNGIHAPELHRLLPVAPEFLEELRARPWRSRCLPTFSMVPEVLFGALIRHHLFASVFRAAAEAMAAENAARLALMQQAERAIDDQLVELQTAHRAARQSEITNDLLDVIAGSEALSRARPRRKRSAVRRATLGNAAPSGTSA
jgi:F-type H+-transporting ATPase subunit gamma